MSASAQYIRWFNEIGIGERAAPVRWSICEGMAQPGIDLDPQLNEAHAPRISREGSPCTVRVIRTREDLVIARPGHALLSRARTGRTAL